LTHKISLGGSRKMLATPVRLKKNLAVSHWFLQHLFGLNIVCRRGLPLETVPRFV